jgi:hypothetical protein
VAAAAAAAAADPPGLRVLLAATTWAGFVGLAAVDAAVPLCSLGYLAYALGFAALTAGVTTMYVRAIFVAPTARGRRRRRRRRRWLRRGGGEGASSSSNAAAADVEAPLLLSGAPSGSPPRRASSLFSRRHQLLPIGEGGAPALPPSAAAAPPLPLITQPSLEYRDYYGGTGSDGAAAAVARVQSLDVRVHPPHAGVGGGGRGGGGLLPSGLEPPPSRLLLRARVDASALTPPVSPLPSAQFLPPVVANGGAGGSSYYPRSDADGDDEGGDDEEGGDESRGGNGPANTSSDPNTENDDEDEPAIANANPAGPARVAAGAAMVSLAAGVGAGAAGVGCGGLVAPELLQLGVHPQSAAATATLLAFMSSSAGALAHAAAGRLLVHVALAFGLASFLGSTVGLALVAARPRWLRTGGKRRAGLVLTLAALAAVGGLLAVGIGVLRFARAWKYDRESLRIGNVC